MAGPLRGVALAALAELPEGQGQARGVLAANPHTSGVRRSARSVALLALAALAGCGGSDDPGELGADVAPGQLVLQLSDLPRGYIVGDDTSCDESGGPGGGGPISVEGGTPRYRDLILIQRPVACNMQLERIYDNDEPGRLPPRVDSMALLFAGEEGAREGLVAARDMLAYMTGEDELRSTALDAELGDEAHVFSTNDALVEGRTHQPGFAIAWRSGPVLAAVLTGGIAGSAGERATLALAERQQERIEAPTPIETDERDDREVALDNPDLGIDVYWLGRSFSPGGELPDIRLYDAAGPFEPGGSPGNLVKIDYTRAVNIDLWEQATWERFLHTRLGRLVWDSPCAQGTRLDLPTSGYAVIYAGYASRVPLPAPTVQSRNRSAAKPRLDRSQAEQPAIQAEPCPDRPFNRFLAHVYLGDVVVSVNLPYCFACARRPTGARDPYNSQEGMEAIVRGLHLRPVGAT